MDDLCRICRTSCLNTSISLSCDHNGVPLKEMLIKTCPIGINFDDPVSQLLPQSICTDCLDAVTSAYKLQQVYLESDQYFRSMVAGGLVTVKTEKIEDEIGVKVEEVMMEVEEVKIKVELDDEPLAKRRKTKPKPARNRYKKGLNETIEDLKKNRKFRPRMFSVPSDGHKWYFCNFCDKKHKTLDGMLLHMQSHRPDLLPFSCEYCVLRLQHPEELVQHVRTAHSESYVKSTMFCDLCGATGNKKEGMAHHMLDDHLKLPRVLNPDSKYTKCPICGAKYILKHRLNHHLLSVHKKATKCDKCEEMFRSKAEIDHHMMTVHDRLYREVEQHEIETILKCCICKDDHTTLDELFLHLSSHEIAFIQSCSVTCFFCPKLMKSYKEFLEHAKYHALPLTQECLTCKKRFPTREKVVSHVKLHRISVKHACAKCPRKFSLRKDLEVHDKVKHQNEKLFICPYCAGSMASTAALEQHIRYVHNKDQAKRFQCASCSKKFVNKTKLAIHEAVHSTDRPHVCEICGSSFKRQHGLEKHMKFVHDPNFEKKFECKQCPLKFGDKYRLNRHLMTHSGLKPHECSLCDKAYAQRGDLTKHMQKHVGDAIYQCNKCPLTFRLIVELREHQIKHSRPSL